METRVSHILVGSFVLAFVALLVAFAIWMTKVDPDAQYKEYDIFFTGSVSGLVNRGTVYYLGIPVGDVRRIGLAPDPRKVQVTVRLRQEVPVNEKSRARLEFQGLTGVAYIEIMGGNPDAAPLRVKDGAERPVIEAEASNFQALFEKAPNLFDESIKAVGAVQELLNDENRQHVTGILKNTNQLTANLARGTEDLDVMMQKAGDLMDASGVMIEKVTKLTESGQALLDEEGKALMLEAKKAMMQVNMLASNMNVMLKANEGTITTFVNGTLPEVSRMVMDLRTTARALSRLMTKIEANPARVVFPPTPKKFNAKSGKVEEVK